MPQRVFQLLIILCTLPLAAEGLAQRAVATTVNPQVNASANDAEEASGGAVTLNNTTLSLNSQTWVGTRFTSVSIPQGAYIISAYVTFNAKNADSTAGTVTIYGENADNSAIFTTTASSISARTDTSSSVSWAIPSWTAATNYNTPELRTIVQEIVNRSGWSSGNSMTMFFKLTSGSGIRRAQPYDGSTTLCPKLFVSYATVTRPIANRLLFVVTSTSAPTTLETARKTFFQDIGYTVTLIAATASQATYDTAAAANDVAYVNEAITSSDLNTKLKLKAIGIVNEEPALSDDYAVASTSANPSAAAITIAKNTHYITSPFATGSLTIASSSQAMNTFSGTLAPDLDTLASVSSVATLVTVESNGKLYDGTTASGRRVFVPWGSSFDFTTLNDNGLYLLSRTLAWAGGMVAYWKLDETSGTVASDSAVNASTGTLYSGLSFSSNSAAPAKVGNGLKFDGLDDYIALPNKTAFQLTKALSISAWVKGNTWGAGDYGDTILRKGDANPNNFQLAICDGKISLSLDDFDAYGIRGNTLLTTGQWYHVAATWDGTTVKIYLNGVLDNGTGAARAAPIGTDTRDVYVGGRVGNTDVFDGTIDDVRLFNYALDVDEITVIKGQAPPGVRILQWVEIK